MSDEDTYYELLGVEPTASKNDVRAAYQSALAAAQDAGRSDEEASVRRAWQVLSDPVQRQRYDESIGVGLRSASTPARVDARVAADDDDEYDDDDYDDADDDAIDAGSVELAHELEPGPVTPGAPLPVGAPRFLEQPTVQRRLVASVIDVVTVLGVMAAVLGITIAITGAGTAATIALIVALELLLIGYFIYPTWRNGQTLGKRFTFVMTVDRHTGELLTLVQAVRRYAVPMVVIPLLASGGLGLFLSLFYGLSYMMARDQISIADRLGSSIVVVARYQPTRHGQAPTPSS